MSTYETVTSLEGVAVIERVCGASTGPYYRQIAQMSWLQAGELSRNLNKALNTAPTPAQPPDIKALEQRLNQLCETIAAHNQQLTEMRLMLEQLIKASRNA